ncbi:MAG TPA: BrnA antitoxin family protein [bacterium]|nr:BrnA antitoxin family protein [bacterium]HPO07355.1 BrnA antitoxin family protein [bacterium]HQO33683.1 BrnA antitoxin family protein [bacterium]
MRSSSKSEAGRTDWQRISKQSDQEIEEAIRADPDAAPLLTDDWFKKAQVVLPEKKVPVSIRLDKDIVEWFRAQQKPYQTLINAVLRTYMEARK